MEIGEPFWLDGRRKVKFYIMAPHNRVIMTVGLAKATEIYYYRPAKRSFSLGQQTANSKW